MRNKATTAFTRIPFQVPNTVAVGELRLRYAYDDGCIVYLNGQKSYHTTRLLTQPAHFSATAGHEAVLGKLVKKSTSPRDQNTVKRNKCPRGTT